MEQNLTFAVPEDDEGTNGQSLEHSDWNNGSGSFETCTYKNPNPSFSHDSKNSNLVSGKMYNAVYRRSKSSRGRKNFKGGIHGVEESMSNSYNHNGKMKMDQSVAMIDDICRTGSMGTRVTADELNSTVSNFRVKEGYGSLEASRSGGDSALKAHEQPMYDEWKSTSWMTVGLRSTRNRRKNYNANMKLLNKRKCHQSARKLSWLMLLEHEESYQYIPQHGDEVAYLKQVMIIIWYLMIIGNAYGIKLRASGPPQTHLALRRATKNISSLIVHMKQGLGS